MIRYIMVCFFQVFLLVVMANGQNTINQLPPHGFDSLRENITHGTLDTIYYPSETVGKSRRALIYLPPGYSKENNYPVLYLLHGIGGDEFEWLHNGHPDVILDNLYAEGNLVPMIVVLPNGRAMKNDRASGDIMSPDKVKAFAAFETDLLNDLITYIDSHFPTLTDKDHRAIAGLSMGGGQSLNFGLGNLDTFSWVGAFSPAPNTKVPEKLIPNPARAKTKLKLLWISCGDSDGLLSYSKRTHDFLVSNQVPHIFYLMPGAHDFHVWKTSLYFFSQLLFKPVDQASLDKYSIVGLPASTNVRKAMYPQILPDGRVIFQIKASDAKKVEVDLGKKYEMAKGGDGYWQVTTDSITEGFHYYSLIVDGVSVADPASQTFYGMGRMVSGIEIPFRGDGYYILKDVPHGDIRQKKYFSPVTHSWRELSVYTPPGYDQSGSSKYPVLYLLHGGGEDQTGWANQGKAALIFDNLLAENRVKRMLIVMPDANIGDGGFSSKGLENSFKMFSSELTQSIIPYVDKNYRTLDNAKNRALAGLSLGGMHTLYSGIPHTDLFAYLGVFSSGWILPMLTSVADSQYTYIAKNADRIRRNLKLLWISDGGKADIAYNNCQIMLDKLDSLHIKHKYFEYPGGHTWPVWRMDLYKFLPELFQ